MKLRGEELCERRSSQFLYMIVRYSQLHHHPSRIGKSTAPVTKRSRVQIPYKPEFFSGFLFATAKVVYNNCDDLLSYNSSPHTSHI